MSVGSSHARHEPSVTVGELLAMLGPRPRSAAGRAIYAQLLVAALLGRSSSTA